MQRHPERKSPQVLFARSTNEWINRVTQKHIQFTQLQLSAEEKAAIERWGESEFIYSTLMLEKIDASREQIARMVSQSSTDASTNPHAFALLKALRRIEELVKTNGHAALFTPELLIELNDSSGSKSGFRKTAGDINRTPKPVPAEHLPAVIESACLWYTAESFAELNPIEQASIVFLRLVEIQPFERANLQTALTSASLFTLRSTLPPVIIKPERETAFLNAMEESQRMNTKPMVELMADAVQSTLDEMIDKSKRQK
jgi:Fic family protein